MKKNNEKQKYSLFPVIRPTVYTSEGRYIIPFRKGEDMLFALDRFFRKSRIENVRKIQVICDEGQAATSCRIAKSTINTLSLFGFLRHLNGKS